MCHVRISSFQPWESYNFYQLITRHAQLYTHVLTFTYTAPNMYACLQNTFLMMCKQASGWKRLLIAGVQKDEMMIHNLSKFTGIKNE